MFIVCGIPRAATTLAAKLISLDPSVFCYAGETHLLSHLHENFEHFPCHPEKVAAVAQVLRTQMTVSMIDMPRFSVANGAHPKNMLFKESTVDDVIQNVSVGLAQGLYGVKLYEFGLNLLEDTIRTISNRESIGEKTPDNLFAAAAYGDQLSYKNFAVVREPIGVIKSMMQRVNSGDPFSDVFNQGIEVNIGIYLEYAETIIRCLKNDQTTLVRYEDIAIDPAVAVKQLHSVFGNTPDKDVLSFVESGKGQEIGDRAPMYYQRLKIKPDWGVLTPQVVHKILTLTKDVREVFGYGDNALQNFGFELPGKSGISDLEKPKFVAVSGFNIADGLVSKLWSREWNKRWIKKNARAIVYTPSDSPQVIGLEFISNFPDELLQGQQATLTISVNGQVCDVAQVGSGLCQAHARITLDSDSLRPLADGEFFALVTLESSVAFCPLVHTSGSSDSRMLSFQLISWRVER